MTSTRWPARPGEAWRTAEAADCPWNRGAVATWLPLDVAVADGSLAPPFAAERAGRVGRGGRALGGARAAPFEQALALARGGSQEGLTEAARTFDRLGADAAAAGPGRCCARRGGSPHAPRAPPRTRRG